MLNQTFQFILRVSTERAIADRAQAVHCPAPGVPSPLWSTHHLSSACSVLQFSILGEGNNRAHIEHSF